MRTHRIVPTVMAALAVVSLLLVVRRVLPVREFSVEGISPYESAEIVAASGVKRGDLLYSLDEEEIEARILERCPYLVSVKLEPVFPGKLRFEVSARTARWYIDVAGAKYALDSNRRFGQGTCIPDLFKGLFKERTQGNCTYCNSRRGVELCT